VVVNILYCYAVAMVFCMVVYKDMQIYRIFLTVSSPTGSKSLLKVLIYQIVVKVKIPLRSVAQTVCDESHDQIAYLGLKVGPKT